MNTKLLEHLNSLKGQEGFIYNNYCMCSGSERSKNEYQILHILKFFNVVYLFKNIKITSFFILIFIIQL